MSSKLKDKGAADNPAAEIDWVARARKLGPRIEAAGEKAEQDGEVTPDIMSALHDAELFRMLIPRSLGGGEATPLELVDVLEAVAAADASTAWCLGQGQGCTFAAAFLDHDIAQEIFGEPDSVLAWGPGSPSAKAIATDGGYRVTGRWRFASGSRHATWLGGHSAVCEADGTPRLDGDGRKVTRTMLFPIASADISNVWQVIGLRGTGSDDYAVDDLFVPEAYTTWRGSAADRREIGPLYSISLLTLYGIAFAAVALGIARATLDEFLSLAAQKTASHAPAVLRENAVIQSGVAQAEARLGSSRAYLVERLAATWETWCAGDDPSLDQRARLRVAITWAMNQSCEVVNFAWQAAGTNAIFENNPFERRFRDMHTVSQQGQAHLSNFEAAGLALLGVDPHSPRV
jgi:alkylation response protein AidB-like acyl-CoA dehydrogenase